MHAIQPQDRPAVCQAGVDFVENHVAILRPDEARLDLVVRSIARASITQGTNLARVWFRCPPDIARGMIEVALKRKVASCPLSDSAA
jgi:hypothetical protein